MSSPTSFSGGMALLVSQSHAPLPSAVPSAMFRAPEAVAVVVLEGETRDATTCLPAVCLCKLCAGTLHTGARKASKPISSGWIDPVARTVHTRAALPSRWVAKKPIISAKCVQSNMWQRPAMAERLTPLCFATCLSLSDACKHGNDTAAAAAAATAQNLQ